MQDGCRILGSGKSGKMAKKYQHHKFSPCLGFPSMGERTRRILHTFSDITLLMVATMIFDVSFDLSLGKMNVFNF